jgi:hypothetical protein
MQLTSSNSHSLLQFNVMGDTVVAALVSRDIEDDIGIHVDEKAELGKAEPEEVVKSEPEKTERTMNTYKIEDQNEVEDMKKSAISA